MNFNKRSWIVGLVAVCLVAAGGMAVLWKKNVGGRAAFHGGGAVDFPEKGFDFFFFEVNPHIERLQNSLRKALRSGAIKAEDFEKLDFSMPGDPAYGDNPDYEVFNPEGKIKARPVGQGLMDMVMTVKGVRPIYNIQRFLFDGTKLRDDLVLLIPNATDNSRKNLCSPSPKSKILPVPVSTDNSKPTDIIDTVKLNGEAGYAGCTLGDDGRMYYIYIISQRYGNTEAPGWNTP